MKDPLTQYALLSPVPRETVGQAVRALPQYRAVAWLLGVLGSWCGALAAMLGVPCFASTHQRGHIAAAGVGSFGARSRLRGRRSALFGEVLEIGKKQIVHIGCLLFFCGLSPRLSKRRGKVHRAFCKNRAYLRSR